MFEICRKKLINLTPIDLEIMKTYEIQQGYTRAIEGYLRLYSKGVVPDTTDIEHVNTEHNRSFIQFNRKL